MASLLSYALTNVADVKESLNIASSDHTKDNLITRKINQATEMIERYCGRRFIASTYTDIEYDSSGTDQLVLKQRPLIVTADYPFTLSSRDTSLNATDWTVIDSELYFIDQSAAVLDLNFRTVGRWNKYKVTYTAGYATIPSDLAEACIELAAFLVSNSSADSNIKKKTEGQRSIEYFDLKSTSASASSLFDLVSITDILNSYCNQPILADK